MSDFGYWSWPLDLVGEYQQIREEISISELPFEQKRKQVVWRGSVKTNEQRKKLVKITEGKQWADVQGVEWATATQVQLKDHEKALTIPDNCRYQFVIHTEGTKHLMANQGLGIPTLYANSSCSRSQLFWTWEIPSKLQFGRIYE